jgi:hypothetical protein
MLVVQRNPITVSTIHQVTPHTSTQPWVVSVHHDDIHEHVQPFDEAMAIYNPKLLSTQN